jgi:hypothetical protein
MPTMLFSLLLTTWIIFIGPSLSSIARGYCFISCDRRKQAGPADCTRGTTLVAAMVDAKSALGKDFDSAGKANAPCSTASQHQLSTARPCL